MVSGSSPARTWPTGSSGTDVAPSRGRRLPAAGLRDGGTAVPDHGKGVHSGAGNGGGPLQQPGRVKCRKGPARGRSDLRDRPSCREIRFTFRDLPMAGIVAPCLMFPASRMTFSSVTRMRTTRRFPAPPHGDDLRSGTGNRCGHADCPVTASTSLRPPEPRFQSRRQRGAGGRSPAIGDVCGHLVARLSGTPLYHLRTGGLPRTPRAVTACSSSSSSRSPCPPPASCDREAPADAVRVHNDDQHTTLTIDPEYHSRLYAERLRNSRTNWPHG